jgi:hypothetical protein
VALPLLGRVIAAPIVLLFGYLNVVFLPLHVEPRFGVALMPGIAALAGVGLARAALWLGRARKATT